MVLTSVIAYFVRVYPECETSQSTPKGTGTRGLSLNENGRFGTDAETLDESFDFSYDKYLFIASLLALNC